MVYSDVSIKAVVEKAGSAGERWSLFFSITVYATDSTVVYGVNTRKVYKGSQKLNKPRLVFQHLLMFKMD